MRILVVEDDAKIRGFLARGLREEGFAVDAVADGEEGLHQALGGEHDAVVLDLGLPGKGGLEVPKALRAARKPVPVLVLTARDGVDDRVRGLDAGADDYLPKPFAMAELLARLRALLRRGTASEGGRLSFGDLEMDLVARRVSRAGQILELTNKEFALLEMFLRAPGEVLPRTVIGQRLWDDAFESFSNVIDVHVRRLRAKLEPAGSAPLIHTVRGVGYVLRRD